MRFVVICVNISEIVKTLSVGGFIKFEMALTSGGESLFGIWFFLDVRVFCFLVVNPPECQEIDDCCGSHNEEKCPNIFNFEY